MGQVTVESNCICECVYSKYSGAPKHNPASVNGEMN